MGKFVEDFSYAPATLDRVAAYAVFGKNHPYQPIGRQLQVDAPVWDAKIYFEEREPERKIINMRDAKFYLPHPSVTPDEYFAQLKPVE